jgi:hypothetical protein
MGFANRGETPSRGRQGAGRKGKPTLSSIIAPDPALERAISEYAPSVASPQAQVLNRTVENLLS